MISIYMIHAGKNDLYIYLNIYDMYICICIYIYIYIYVYDMYISMIYVNIEEICIFIYL